MKNKLHDPIYFAPTPKLGGGWITHKDSPSPPPAPDYTGAAIAQGAANVETARAQGRMNNPNVYTPYGSQTVTWGQGQPVFNEQGYNQALQQYQATARTPPPGVTLNDQGQYYDQGLGSWIAPSGPTGTAPTREQFTTTPQSDQPTITQQLSPAQQRLLDAQNRISGNLANVAETGLNRVSSGFDRPFDQSNLNPVQTSAGANPNYTSSVNQPNLQTSYDRGGQVQYGNGYNGQIQGQINPSGQQQTSLGNYGQAQTGFDTGGQQQTSFANGGPVQTSFNQGGPIQTGNSYTGQVQGNINTNGVQAIPTVDPEARQHAEDLAYRAATSRLDPQWQQRRAMQDTQLRNQGLVAGGEAYDAAQRDLGYQQNDAYLQAQANAVNQGLTNQQAQFGMGLAANQAGFGQAQAQGQFTNAAQGQAYNQGLANANLNNTAQGQIYGQNLGAMQAQNAAQGQQFGQNQALANFANTAQQNQYAQNQGLAAFGNAAQNQNYNQALGAGQFANTAQQNQFGQNLAGGQFANAAQNQGFTQAQAAQQAYNAAQAQENAQNQNQAQFANTAAGQQFGMGQQNAVLGNQVGQQQFQQGLANANLGNQATQQQIQQQAYLRSLPLNELNALRTGAQVTNPQFQPYQGSQIGQTPIFGAAQAQGAANQNAYNAQVAQNNAFNSGLFSLGSAGLQGYLGGLGETGASALMLSDRRLKSNIARIGTHKSGIGIYEYDIFGHRTIGIMADEVESVMPNAVLMHGSGYKMVDYGRL